jgi:hypothetical protein
MFKTLFTTALLASTTLAYEFVEAYSNQAMPTSILYVQDVINFNYFYSIDFGYYGYYKTEPNDATRRIKDSIGLKLFSSIKASFYIELFDHIKAIVEFAFTPIEFVPAAM